MPRGKWGRYTSFMGMFYFKVIPIVLDNILIRFVKKKYNLPMIILNDWTDLIGMELKYQDYDNSILDVNILKKEILNSYYINNQLLFFI